MPKNVERFKVKLIYQNCINKLLLIFAVVLLSSLLACSQSQPPQLTNGQWQQQLALPSVLQATDLGRRMAELVHTEAYDWTDASRQREVPVLVYLPKGWSGVDASKNMLPMDAAKVPAKALLTQKMPLIVFSHGLGGSRDRYAYLGQYWASQGFASLHVQHVGSDRQIWRGSRLTLPFRLMAAAGETEALARVADIKFALTRLLQSEQGNLIDPAHIVMAGHSYGANTAMLLVGAKVERPELAVSLQDDRFSAAILISAPPFYDDVPLPPVLTAVTVPTLHITNTMDEIEVPGYYSAPSDRIALYQAMGSNHKVLAVFYGGSHNIFSGRRQPAALAVQDQVLKAATQSLSTAFVRQFSGRQHDALQQWQQQHQAVLAEFDVQSITTQ